MTWPQRIPYDLEKALGELDQRRDAPAEQDRWGVMREWLVAHGIQPPNDLPERPEPKSTGDWHST